MPTVLSYYVLERTDCMWFLFWRVWLRCRNGKDRQSGRQCIYFVTLRRAAIQSSKYREHFCQVSGGGLEQKPEGIKIIKTQPSKTRIIQ